MARRNAPMGHNQALIGWYRATEGAVRSKGSIYFHLHQHGQTAYGR